MTRLRFWHPILLSRELRPGRVASVTVAGAEIAVFRDQAGKLGAIADRCAHRRMKLSRGRVEGARLVCPYHGWSYASDGNGRSPANPRLSACVPAYAAGEVAGAIWIRSGEAPAPPFVEAPSGAFAGVVRNEVEAPLQLVIDNFSEVEHTIAIHDHFGFDAARAEAARVELTMTDDEVTLRNSGPTKRLPIEMRIIGAMRQDDLFHSDFTFRFDPPRSMAEHRWTRPSHGEARPFSYRLIHYFVPRDEARTCIISFAWLSLGSPLARAFHRPIAALFRRGLRKTVDEDAQLLAGLADRSIALDGMRLGRFDAVLPQTRERLNRIYAP